MPCNDITDFLTLQIASDDRIADYTLHKRTCGGAVGEEQLIGPWLFKRTVAQVIDTSLDDFHARLRTKQDLKEYLALKHFLAVQSALAIYLGRETGSVADRCTIEAIEYGPDGVTLSAHLDVKAMTDEIAACKNCCGSKADADQFAV